MTREELIQFEDEMAERFAAGEIRAPLHLSGGNEEQLIEIFKDIQPNDWVLVGWRSHYHCLLKGVPRSELIAAILTGHSVSLCFPKQRILCSGIVGGIAPIAVGIAWAIKQKQERVKVFCFLGDMSAETGIVHECTKYASAFGLPLFWIVEDNGLSVCTDTKRVWGGAWSAAMGTRYDYRLTRRHVGIAQWVRF